jgi:hypothetical protein
MPLTRTEAVNMKSVAKKTRDMSVAAKAINRRYRPVLNPVFDALRTALN